MTTRSLKLSGVCATIALLLLLPAPLAIVFAQDTTTLRELPPGVAPPEDKKVLQVEVLLFKHQYSETHAKALYEIQKIDDLFLPAARSIFLPAGNATGNATDNEFDFEDNEIIAITNYDLFLLGKHTSKIRASRQFEYLHHIAWTQPIYKEKDAAYINILPEHVNGLVAGVVRVVPGQYNRFDIQLHYDLDSGPIAEPKNGNDKPERVATGAAAIPTSRILEINFNGVTPDGLALYLDHPILSALAVVKLTTRSVLSNPTPVPSTIY